MHGTRRPFPAVFQWKWGVDVSVRRSRPALQICPICAALPGGDPNHVTDDFAAHLTLEHRAPRDLISFSNVFLRFTIITRVVLYWHLSLR